MSRALYGGVQPITILRAAARRLARLHRVGGAVESGASRADAMGALRPPVFPRERAAFAQALARWPSARAAGGLGLLTRAERDCKVSGGAPAAICSDALLRIARATRRGQRRNGRETE